MIVANVRGDDGIIVVDAESGLVWCGACGLSSSLSQYL